MFSEGDRTRIERLIMELHDDTELFDPAGNLQLTNLLDASATLNAYATLLLARELAKANGNLEGILRCMPHPEDDDSAES